MQKLLSMESSANNTRTLQGGLETLAVTFEDMLKFIRAKPGARKQQMLSCTHWKIFSLPFKMQVQGYQCHHCGKLGHIKLAFLAIKRIQMKQKENKG